MRQGFLVRPAFPVGQLTGSPVELRSHLDRLFRRTSQGGESGSELIEVRHNKKSADG